MKRNNYLIAGAVALTCVFASCNSGTQVKSAALNSTTDSLAYAMGIANTDGLSNWLTNSMDVDTTYMNEFIKGILDAKSNDNPKQKAYRAGLQIGQQIAEQMIPGMNQMIFQGDSTQSFNADAFYDGFVSAIKKSGLKMSAEEALEYAETTVKRIQQESIEKQYSSNKTEGEAFLAGVKAKEGVQATESGLLYEVLKEGKGPKPTENDKVKVNYKGTLINGNIFDASENHGGPAEFGVSDVIAGWTEALQLMPVGSKWKIYIPYNLAYGERGSGGTIPPYSALIFEVELLEILK